MKIGVNQRLTKTFPSLIDNHPKICYNVTVIKLQIHAKGGDDYDELIFIGLSSYRLRYAERKVYIVFEAHPISGVFFVCLKHLW